MGTPWSEISGAPSLGAHLRGVSLDCGAKEAARVVLDQAEAEVGQGDEPAEIVLRHDLRGVRAPGVVRHVIDGQVGHEILHV